MVAPLSNATHLAGGARPVSVGEVRALTAVLDVNRCVGVHVLNFRHGWTTAIHKYVTGHARKYLGKKKTKNGNWQIFRETDRKIQGGSRYFSRRENTALVGRKGIREVRHILEILPKNEKPPTDKKIPPYSLPPEYRNTASAKKTPANSRYRQEGTAGFRYRPKGARHQHLIPPKKYRDTGYLSHGTANTAGYRPKSTGLFFSCSFFCPCSLFVIGLHLFLVLRIRFLGGHTRRGILFS